MNNAASAMARLRWKDTTEAERLAATLNMRIASELAVSSRKRHAICRKARKAKLAYRKAREAKTDAPEST